MTVPRPFTLVLAVAVLAGGFLSAAADAASRTVDVAQLTLPSSAPATNGSGIEQQGLYVTAPIVLDGATLFRVAEPANALTGQLPIASRVDAIETALDQLLAVNGTGSNAATVFDPKTLRIHTRRAGDAVVLEAVDGKHQDPLPLLTVTSVDARANSVDTDALASEWENILQSALVRALVLRQPSVERRSVQRVAQLAALLIAISVIVGLALRDLWQRMARLEQAIVSAHDTAAAEHVAAPEKQDAPQRRRRFFALQLRTLKPVQRLGFFGAIAETLLWLLAIAWVASAAWSLSLFPETTPLAQTIAHGAIGVVTTVVFALLLSRALDAIIARFVVALRLRRFSNAEDRARSMLRAPTIARAVAGAKSFVIVFVAALSVLGQIGVPIGSVVTIGGVTAIALSLAAQNFVRDFLNGFLVLLEDQYVVGDYVTINTYSGIVERLTLRMVQIRDAAGDVVTIPHSSVTNVVNQSRNWSRVDYRVPVDPHADIPKAIAIVRARIAALAIEHDFMHGDEPIEWVGIDALSRDGVIVRASVRTAPLRQFELRRRINADVLAAFAADGIALGAPIA